MRRPVRPLGHVTRGKTALNRLRQIDVYGALAYHNTLVGGAPLIVDLGYGAYPWTALEMADRLRVINPAVRLLGIEIDPDRVAAAQPYAIPDRIAFAVGGFNIQHVIGGPCARLIRAYNVLRQYDEDAVLPALREMGAALEENGLLIEGTCNPTGRAVVFDVYRRRGDALVHDALVFGTNFRAPLEAEDFRAILPKRLIHHAHDPALAAFFAAWQRGFVQWRGGGIDRRRVWINAAMALSDHYPIDRQAGLIRRGYLTVRTPLIGDMIYSL